MDNLQAMRKFSLLQKCRPAVLRFWLLLAAGLLWSGVGTVLCIMACYWLSLIHWPANAAGVVLGWTPQTS